MRQPLLPVRIGTANRAGRAAWGIVYLFLYRPSPRLLHGWRRFLLRCFGAAIGPGAHPYPLARIWAPWNLTMDRDAGMADHVDCYCVAGVHIGAGTTVSQYAYLCTASHDVDLPGMPMIAAPIVVGDGAWVAAGAFIGPGVTIGTRAVVGARSTVVRDVAPGAIVADTPARLLRMRPA